MNAEKSIEIKRIDCGKYVIRSGEKTFEVSGMSELIDIISYLENEKKGAENDEH